MIFLRSVTGSVRMTRKDILFLNGGGEIKKKINYKSKRKRDVRPPSKWHSGPPV